MSFVPTDHTNPGFNALLGTIGNLVTEMSTLCEQALIEACLSIENNDRDLARGISKKDGRINQLEGDITMSVASAIARHNPVAHDLHALMGSVKLAQEFERLADHAKNVGRRNSWLLKMGSEVAFKEQIIELGRNTRDMLHEFLSAETANDMERISVVWHMDSKVNDIYMDIMRKALDGEASDDSRVLINTIFIAKNFERIGDKVKNLAEVVTYQQTGEIVDFDSQGDEADDDETGAEDS